MRHWNYRLIRRREHYPDGTTEDYYAIHEVYYTKKGKPRAVTAEPVRLISETPDGVAWQLKQMRRALKRPVLDYEDIGKEYEPRMPSMDALIRINAEDTVQRDLASIEDRLAKATRKAVGLE